MDERNAKGTANSMINDNTHQTKDDPTSPNPKHPPQSTNLDDYHNKQTLPMPNYVKPSTTDSTVTSGQNEQPTNTNQEQLEVNIKSSYGKKVSDSKNSADKPWYTINKELVSLKIILFCWYGAGACLLPYMTLHMKQLGLTMVEMTAIYAILPIIQLLGTPLAGFIADKTGNYKSVLLFTLSTCIVTTFLLQFFVPARKQVNPAPPTTADAEDEPDPLYMLTFWLYLVIRVFHQVAVGLTYVLLDTTTLVLAHQNDSNYGRQRFWAILSTAIFSPICGLVIDQISTNTTNSFGSKVYNYDPAFHFFNVLTAITLFKSSLLDIEISALPKNVWKDVKFLLKSGNVWIFLFSVFVMGSCWGFLESFLFIHLEKIGAPTFLLGLTVTVGALVGLPFLFESDWFVKKIGATELLIFALLVYTVRLVGYSLLDNPWFCIPYELMEAFTLHLMWVSTVGLAFKISPPGMLATLQAIVGGLNFAVGRGFGSLVGGSIMVVYDIRTAFRVLAGLAFATALLWAILHKFFHQPLDHLDKKTPQMLQPRSSTRSSKDVEARNQAIGS